MLSTQTVINVIERNENVFKRYTTDGLRLETLFRTAADVQKSLPENKMAAVAFILKHIPQAKALLSDVWDEFGIMYCSGREESVPYKVSINGQPMSKEVSIMNSVVPTAILHQTRVTIEEEHAREIFASGGSFAAIGSGAGWAPIAALNKEHSHNPRLVLADINERAINIARRELVRLDLDMYAGTYATGLFADNVSREFPVDAISTIGFDGYYMPNESFIEFQRAKWNRLDEGGYLLFDTAHDNDEVVRDTIEYLLHLQDVQYSAGLSFRYRSIEETLSLIEMSDLGAAEITIYTIGDFGSVFKVSKI